MTIISKRDEFADAQAHTDTAISNVIDLGATNTLKDIASGRQVFLAIVVKTAYTRAAGALTITFTLESDSTANLATSPTIHIASAAIAKADLIAGYRLLFALPPNKNYERYLGVRATASAAFDAGAFSAFLTDAPQTNVAAYADAL